MRKFIFKAISQIWGLALLCLIIYINHIVFESKNQMRINKKNTKFLGYLISSPSKLQEIDLAPITLVMVKTLSKSSLLEALLCANQV